MLTLQTKRKTAVMKFKLLLTVILLCVVGSVFSQSRYKRRAYHREKPDTSIVVAYVDSLKAYKVKADTLRLYADTSLVRPVPDSRFSLLFSPFTYYSSAIRRSMVLGEDGMDGIDEAVGSVLIDAYLKCPDCVEFTDMELAEAGELHEEITKPLRHKVEYATDSEDVPEVHPDVPLEIVVAKPNFWTFSGDYYLQFLQNFVSGNWYKGGESDYSMLSSVTLQANYNNKQKVKFENKLELKLGLLTSRGDTLHSVRTSEDLIRYTGKLGLQATKNWYYTLQLIAQTQFMRGYKSNDAKVYSDILSPLNLNFSLGMSYNVDVFKGRLKGSIQLAPLAYNFKYVGRRELAADNGLEAGRHTKNEFGSGCTFDLNWTFSDLIKWKTRLYAYTTYKRMQMEWENTVTFQFNKYLSSNLFVYPRFDDSTANKDASLGYWQFKEYLSIGFAYSF